MDIQAKEFLESILDLDRVKAKRIFQEAIKNMTSLDFIDKILFPALEKIGCGWEDGNLALSQIYMSSKLCEELIDELLPNISHYRITSQQIAIAVLDDYHFLGKRIVSAILKSNGYNLIDYGSINANNLVNSVKNDSVKILLISVLMMSSALKIKEVAKALEDEGVKIIVGGAPFRFDSELWKNVGAYAMGYNASDSVDIIKKILGDEQ